MKAFILAAGFGTRMGGLSTDLPKPLLDVGGYPMLVYTLFQLWRWRVSEAVINLHYHGDKIASFLRNFPYFPIHFSFEKEILGTAGGIINALHYFQNNEPFIVINPDTVLFGEKKDNPDAVVQLMLEKNCLSCLFLKERLINSTEQGMELSLDGRLQFVGSGGKYFYLGYSVLSPGLVEGLPAGHVAQLGRVWQNSAKEGRLMGREFGGKIFGVGTHESYQKNKTVTIPEDLRDEWLTFIKLWPGYQQVLPRRI